MPLLGLPSARSTVNRGVRQLKRRGYDRCEALHLIIAAADRAMALALALDGHDNTWLEDIYREAMWQHQWFGPGKAADG